MARHRRTTEDCRRQGGRVWEFRHENDETVLSAWARHFRDHYCFDSEIDYWRRGYKCSREEYLNTIKFPDQKNAPGPSIRAGDFGEVLVADFLEYLLGYWVPRTCYGDKTIRNESTKGSDIIGFHIVKDGKASSKDRLAIFEAKAPILREEGQGETSRCCRWLSKRHHTEGGVFKCDQAKAAWSE